MIENQMIVVLVGAAAHYLTGWALCSHLLLGRLWKNDKEKMKSCGMHQDMRINIALQIITSIALSAATCAAICAFQKNQSLSMLENLFASISGLFFNQNNSQNMMHAVHAVMFIWAGFIVPTSVSEVIWCGHHWKKWMIEMTATIIELVVLAMVIVSLS